MLTIEIGEKLEGMLPADQKGLIDFKGTFSLLLQRGEEQLLFFSWTFRLKETFSGESLLASPGQSSLAIRDEGEGQWSEGRLVRS